MAELAAATREAVALLASGDRARWPSVALSFSVPLRAPALATPFAIRLGFALAYARFPGRRLLVSVFNVLMAVAAVDIGLLVYLLLTRDGPDGALDLLFSPTAMIIGQVLLVARLLPLADEITANFDVDKRRRTYAVIADRKRAGTCVVFASHDPEPVTAQADLHLEPGDGGLQTYAPDTSAIGPAQTPVQAGRHEAR